MIIDGILPPHTKKKRVIVLHQLEIIGGAKLGATYSEFFIKAESIHQNVGFSGYPIGNITMDMAIFGSIEELCKSLNNKKEIYDYDINL